MMMNRRSAISIAFSLAIAFPCPVLAQGNGNGQSDDNSDLNAGGQGNGNNGQGNGNNGQGGDNGANDNGNAGQNGGSAVTSESGAAANPATSAPPTAADSELLESDALGAVETGRAVALSTILPDVRTRTGGEIIDAQLQQVRGILLYAVTVLTPSGRVTTEYYYASTGQHVDQ